MIFPETFYSTIPFSHHSFVIILTTLYTLRIPSTCSPVNEADILIEKPLDRDELLWYAYENDMKM